MALPIMAPPTMAPTPIAVPHLQPQPAWAGFGVMAIPIVSAEAVASAKSAFFMGVSPLSPWRTPIAAKVAILAEKIGSCGRERCDRRHKKADFMGSQLRYWLRFRREAWMRFDCAALLGAGILGLCAASPLHAETGSPCRIDNYENRDFVVCEFD